MEAFALSAAAELQRAHPSRLLVLLPLFPLLGAAINGLAGRRLQARLGRSAVHAVALLAMLASSAVALASVSQLIALPPAERYLHQTVFPMIHLGHLAVDLGFALDPLSGMMALVITLVGTAIHVYSTGYMAEEPSYWRYFAYLNLFVFAMLLLVLGENFVVLFFGWEGVGLCSYLLIGFWYRERSSATAGLKAFVTNRVGDWGFLLGVLLLFWGLGGVWDPLTRAYQPELASPPGAAATVHSAVVPAIPLAAAPDASDAPTPPPDAVQARAEVPIGPTLSFRALREQFTLTAGGRRPLVDGGVLPVRVDGRAATNLRFEGLAQKTLWGVPLVFLVCLFLFLGATGKSAQIPLYVWLPDAMAGPTPVSALIHAATMVTAGVYLIARLGFLFVLSPGAMTVVATAGALTALLGASIGLLQYDIKKVLAYSTVSQLGFMFLGVGVGAHAAGVFHLVTHACFKACLFLGAGSVIHGMHALTHHRAGPGAHAGQHAPAPHDPRLAPDPTDPQDMRNMGGLAALMPRTRWAYLAACWAIAGFPLASGFYSKDEILWQAFASRATLVPGALLWAAGTLAAAGTSFYMFRSYYLTFHHRPPSAEHYAHVHESPASITTVLALLGLASLLVGPVLGLPRLWTGRAPLLEHFLEPVTALAARSLAGARAPLEAHGLEWTLAGLSVLVALLGWLAARALYRDGARTEARLRAWKERHARLHRFVFETYRIDPLYQALFVRSFQRAARAAAWFDAHVIDRLVNLSGQLTRAIAHLDGAVDRYLVDGAVNLVASGVIASGRELRKLQTGRINHYPLIVTAGVVLILLAVTLG